MKIAILLSANVSAYALRARFIFLTGKNMAAPSVLILQMVTYLHAGSHIKPRRVKIRMQMRAGFRHKALVSWCSFCFGQELVKEAEVSLKRQ